MSVTSKTKIKMSGINETTNYSLRKVCRACLTDDDSVRIMTAEDIIAYENIVKMSTIFHGYLCFLCKSLLNKFTKFVEQCKLADNYLLQYTQGAKTDFLTKLTLVHNIGLSIPIFHYQGPNTIDQQDDTDSGAFDNEECLPLVMLRDRDGIPLKKKRKSKKKSQIDPQILEHIKQEPNDLPECSDDSKKVKVELREGFTSRMVQETAEYIVIKLSKEQVLQEMGEKRDSDIYKRALYKCDKCVKGFNFEDVLQSHLERHTVKVGYLLCDICSQYCPSSVSLRGHLKSHTTRYKCKVCGYVRLSRQHLLEHYNLSHSSVAAAYSCQECGFTTSKRTVMQRHVKSHNPSELHPCHECGKLFKRMEQLRIHTIRHDKTKRLSCPQCDRKFLYPSLLDKHVLSVHERKDYYCVECDVTFTSLDNMRLHFKKALRHRDSSSYNTCGRTFNTGANVRGHARTENGDEKSAKCAVCAKVFTRKSALAAHMRTHNGLRAARRPPCPPAQP